MQTLSVDRYKLEFPASWTVAKFDEWIFYRKHFCTVRDGIKAMDVVAVSGEGVAYLVEFKDYRGRKREKLDAIDAEFIEKTLCTLAAMLPAACNARDATEQELATKVLRANAIKLVLHLDQSKPGNKLFPPVVDAARLTQKLRNKLKSLDGRLKVCSSSSVHDLPWTVATTR